MVWRLNILFLSLTLVMGCTTMGKKKKGRKSITKHENMTLDKITAEDGLPGIRAKAVLLSKPDDIRTGLFLKDL